MKPAEELFEAQVNWIRLESDVTEAIGMLIGNQYDDMLFDYYDQSVEIISVAEFPEVDRLDFLWEMGFKRAWLHKDGREVYYEPGVKGVEKPSARHRFDYRSNGLQK